MYITIRLQIKKEEKSKKLFQRRGMKKRKERVANFDERNITTIHPKKQEQRTEHVLVELI